MPRGTWNTGISFFKTPLYLHWSTIFLPILLVLYDGVNGLWEFAVLFASLMFHEYGHVFAAKKLGFKPAYVLSHGVGAFAYIPGDLTFYESPKLMAMIAGAGPAASLMLWATTWIFWFLLLLVVGPSPLDTVFKWLVPLNFLLAVFNLLPFYPSDGGRILHSIILTIVKLPSKALALTANIGLVFVALISSVMLYYGQFWIVFVSLFLGWMALKEKNKMVPILKMHEAGIGVSKLL